MSIVLNPFLQKWLNMKMRVRGVTLERSHLGGYKLGGAAIALNTEWKILISHRNILRGIV